MLASKSARPFFEILPLTSLDAGTAEMKACTHTLHHTEIVWIQNGNASHIVNQHSFNMTSGQLHCAVFGQQQQLHLHPGTRGYLIAFNDTFLNSSHEDFNSMEELLLFNQLAQHEPLCLENELSDELQEIASKLFSEHNRSLPLKNEMVSKYLKIFLIHIRRQFDAHQSMPEFTNNSLFSNFLWLLENNYKEKKSVAEYASELSVTPCYLNHVIKKASGRPASHHIQQRIILEAKRKVTRTGASMKEVAYFLGFNDISHFSKFFKTSSGMNFTTFRNINRQQRA